MKTQLTTLHNGSEISTMTGLLPGRKSGLALIMGLLWAGALALPALGGQPGAVLTNVYSFQDDNAGASPEAGLVQGSDGNFYGTTFAGGTNGSYGTVFKMMASGTLTTLVSFDSTNGAGPQAGLVQGTDGNLYGTTSRGGTNGGYGTVFKISTNGPLTSLYSFTGSNDGAYPEAGLVQGSDGNFYGTTSGGGTSGVGYNGDGTVFRISTNGTLTNLFSFTNGIDGAEPPGGLVQGSDGSFYGTTFVGSHGGGTVFKISTNGTLAVLHSFTNSIDGYHPQAGLVQGSDGYLYGTTYGNPYADGSPYGTVFKISTNGTLTGLYSFTGGDDGAYPEAGLVQASDGNFYGTTDSGGTSGFGGAGDGTVFKINTNGTLTTLYSFTGFFAGNPIAGLVQGGDGNFYGTIYSGGIGLGTIYRVTVAPESQTVALTNGTLTLTWSTGTGGTYQVQYIPNLSSSTWANLSSPTNATGPTLTATDSITNGPQRFYRLMLSP